LTSFKAKTLDSFVRCLAPIAELSLLILKRNQWPMVQPKNQSFLLNIIW